ncbi:CDGSH iron-sulfur domain-containing protein [Streptomyces sp. NPDC001594]|uniref:CDGSH iron-sulfur domain-containing protein n=1 Tax=Streptomyces sp. NPDC001594 TaxID=3364590 RepID=UPI003691DE65
MPSTPEPQYTRPPAAAGQGPRPRRVRVERGGPVLVEGPVEITLDDGTTVRSDRFTVAVCTCRRSRTYPWCDTSHRPRERAAPACGRSAEPCAADGRGPEDGSDR